MPRPQKCRIINGQPASSIFKPAGIPKCDLEEIVLTLDEFEALRLTDFEGLYQDAAAESMNISRQTLGNILVSARHKIADCLINGKALRIEGGPVDTNRRIFICKSCHHRWATEELQNAQESCPACGHTDMHNFENNCGQGRRCRKAVRKFQNGEWE